MTLISAVPEGTFIAVLSGAATGLIGLTVEIQTLNGMVVQAASTAEVAEIVVDGVATGGYVATRTAPSIPGQYQVVWSESTVQDLLVSAPLARTRGATYAAPTIGFTAASSGVFTAGESASIRIAAVTPTGALALEWVSSAHEPTPQHYKSVLPPLTAGDYALVWTDGVLYHCEALHVGPLGVANSFSPLIFLHSPGSDGAGAPFDPITVDTVNKVLTYSAPPGANPPSRWKTEIGMIARDDASLVSFLEIDERGTVARIRVPTDTGDWGLNVEVGPGALAMGYDSASGKSLAQMFFDKIGFFNGQAVARPAAPTSAQAIADALATLGLVAPGGVIASGGVSQITTDLGSGAVVVDLTDIAVNQWILNFNNGMQWIVSDGFLASGSSTDPIRIIVGQMEMDITSTGVEFIDRNGSTVFRVDRDGDLHGKVGKALTFDL